MSVCSTLCEVMSYISAECLVNMFLSRYIYIYVCVGTLCHYSLAHVWMPGAM